MAEAAVSFVIERIGALFIQKVTFLKGVRGQVELLQSELARMRGFLKYADEKQDEDTRIRNWVSEIRAVAYDAENVLEIFVVKRESLKKKGFLRKLACFPMQISLLNKVGKEIESLQTRINNIADSRQRYDIKYPGESPNTQTEELQRLRFSSPFVEDKDIVGLEAKMRDILSQLLKDDKKRHVMSIVGIGGVGKTTLAKSVYNHPDVKAHFNCQVWICISQNYSYKNILGAVMKQVREPTLQLLEMLEKMEEQDLEQMLYKELESKCYLTVLDDIWGKEVWDCLARAFPDGRNGSRLLLTTRNRDVPLCIDPLSIPYELEPLDHEDSWQLLLRKVFGDSNNLMCSPELEGTGREIARQCAGLPLAITVIGGLLARKKSLKREWERVLSNIGIHLSSESQVSSILALSYYDLPTHLKSSFLYFGLFPEDREIAARKLIHLWVAEGLIQQKGTDSLERIAEDYLEELINRNMVQAARVTADERIKSCRVHDVLRELAISKAKEEILLEIHGQGVRDVPGSAHSRYLALYSQNDSFNFSAEARPHIRSIFFFSYDIFQSEFRLGLKNFRLLRVADLESIRIRSLPEGVGKLCLLRYLCLRDSIIGKIPRSLCFLQSLQTLDLCTAEEVEVPNVIWKLENLRHLFLYKIKNKEPLKVEGLSNLRTLSRIHCDHLVQNNLKGLTSVSELGVWVEENSELEILFMSLVELKKLRFLRLYGFDYSKIPSLASLCDLHALTELKLSGRLQMLPQPNQFPSNLSHLTLADSCLAEDPMPTLMQLPALTFLRLSRAYGGKKLMISENGFPQLKFLDLNFLSELDEITVKQGAMPELKSLRIRGCDSLEMLPEGLKSMTGLEKLEIVDMPTSFTTRLRGVDSYKVCHVRTVTMRDMRRRDRVERGKRRIRAHAQIIRSAFLFHALVKGSMIK